MFKKTSKLKHAPQNLLYTFVVKLLLTLGRGL